MTSTRLIMQGIVVLVASAWLAGCAQQSGTRVGERTKELQGEGVEESPGTTALLPWQRDVLEGDAAHRAGRHDKALYHYLLAEQALTDAQARPDSLPRHANFFGDEVLWRIALVHEAAGRWQAASDTWALAARRTDRGGENLQRLGWARLQLQQPAAAREAFKAALIHDPNHLQARLGLARVSEAQGDWSLAAQYLDEVLNLDPTTIAARLARVRIALRQQEIAVAKENLRLILRQGAPQETYVLLGDVLAYEGDYAKALQAYVKHLSLHESWARLGRLAMQRQDYVAAIRYLEQAAKESPIYLEELNKQRAVAKEWQQSSLTVTP